VCNFFGAARADRVAARRYLGGGVDIFTYHITHVEIPGGEIGQTKTPERRCAISSAHCVQIVAARRYLGGECIRHGDPAGISAAPLR